MIKLLALPLLVLSFQAIALPTEEQASTKFTQQNNKNDRYLIEMYKALEQMRESLHRDKQLNLLQEKISKTSDKNELTRLYCVEYRTIKEQSLNAQKKFYGTNYETNEIYASSAEHLNTLTVACQKNDITKLHKSENEIYIKFAKYLVIGLSKRQKEYDQYNEAKNLLEEIQIIRKRLQEEKDPAKAQEIVCIDYLNQMEKISNKAFILTESPLKSLAPQLKEASKKLRARCEVSEY